MRTSSPPSRFRWYQGVPFLFLLLAGCGDSVQVSEVCDGVENMSKFGRAYQQFHEANGRPPKSAEELKPVLQELGDPTQLMTSPTDNKPYVVHWGIDPAFTGDDTGETGGPMLDPNVGLVIAHEADGDGDQVVAFTTSGVLTLTKEELQKGLPSTVFGR